MYVTWALKNVERFQWFFKLNKEEVQKVYQAFPNGLKIFLQALKSHEKEMDFINNHFSSLLSKQYFVSRDVEKISLAQQEDSRLKIIQLLYTFSEEETITPKNWIMPSRNVLDGSSQMLDKEGYLRQFYETGAIAVVGLISKKKRSGEWNIYFENGKTFAEGLYVDGRKEGTWNFYASSGKLKLVGQYQDDIRLGEWKEFDHAEDIFDSLLASLSSMKPK